jgi:hypothetical protein
MFIYNYFVKSKENSSKSKRLFFSLVKNKRFYIQWSKVKDFFDNGKK